MPLPSAPSGHAVMPSAIVAATSDSLPHQAQALSRARAFAEPLLASEQLDTGENILAHADAVAAIEARPPFAVAVNTTFVPNTRYAAHTLQPGESLEAPVVFYIDPEIADKRELDGLMLDFYLIVSDYGDAYPKHWMAVANRLIPPNVFPFQHDGLIAKYAVLSEGDFNRLNGPETRNVSVWARFAQPSRLVWAADIGGYIVGKPFGKHKLLPKVSPGKTVEGMLGGLALVALVVTVVAMLQDWPAQTPVWYIAALLLTVLSVFGDLTESMFKRAAGKKDSGAFLPGHGGILDRIDSLTATAPLFAIIVALYSGFY